MEEVSGGPSLVLVEEHEALREGLAVLLGRSGFSVLASATTAAHGEREIDEQKPDLAVVGLDLPDERGTELIRRLSGGTTETKFVIYASLTGADMLETAFRSGARGLVAKPASVSVLVEALHKVWRGGRYFDSSFSEPESGNGGKALSVRESEVLDLLAHGLTGEEIATRLVLSPETVRTHIRNAMAKLEAKTRTEAVVKALKRKEIVASESGNLRKGH